MKTIEGENYNLIHNKPIHTKLVVPVNWEEDYFDKINFSQTAEIYGKQNLEYIGGGRPVFTIAKVSKEKVKEFVDTAHSKNLKFNYLLNATCIDNLELSKKGYGEIRKILDWLSSIHVDIITVTLPFLLEMIKYHYPHFKVSVSVQARIDCVEKVKYWEDIGADKLNLSYVDVNKNFSDITKIAQKARVEIQTIANLICMDRCPYVTLHGNYNAHNSQCKHIMDNFSMDYYLLNCLYKIFSNPVEILKSAMIRPEDIHLYEEAGLHYIKLVERSMTTNALAKIVQAYTDRKYDGNLMDLLPGISKDLIYEKKWLFMEKLKYIFQPSKINLFKMQKMINNLNKAKENKEFSESFNLYIDNKLLDGFMDYYVAGECHHDCSNCSHCDVYAEKAIRYLIPKEKHLESLQLFKNSRKSIISGEIFK